MAEIALQNTVVDYPIYNAGSMSLRNTLVSVGTGGIIARGVGNIVTVRAIDDVTATISHGDRVGLIGHNGAGKSTLLRVIAGIYSPISGSVRVSGTVASILELGAGMDRELTGYENIVRMAMFQGATKRQAQAMIPDVEDFTQLGNFLSMPVHTYSAGMMTRLSFAVATASRPDILLIDEVLGVGDAEFQLRAKERLERMIDEASIFVLASHSQEIIELYCNRTLYFEHGKLLDDKRL